MNPFFGIKISLYSSRMYAEMSRGAFTDASALTHVSMISTSILVSWLEIGSYPSPQNMAVVDSIFLPFIL